MASTVKLRDMPHQLQVSHMGIYISLSIGQDGAPFLKVIVLFTEASAVNFPLTQVRTVASDNLPLIHHDINAIY